MKPRSCRLWGRIGERISSCKPKGKSGRLKLVLELVLGFALALSGAFLFITACGYNFWDFLKEKMVETLPTEPMMIGGEGDCTQLHHR